MRRRNARLGGLLSALALAAAGCGDLCGRGTSVYSSLSAKYQRCVSPGFNLCFDQGACESALPSCGSADQRILNAQLDCYEAAASAQSCPSTFELPSCPDAGTLSQPCQSALQNAPTSCGADGG